MNRGHRRKPGQKIADNPPRVGRIARRTVQPLAHRYSRNEAKAVIALYVDAKKGDASVVPARRLPQLLLRQCPTDRPFSAYPTKMAALRRLRIALSAVNVKISLPL